MNDRDRSILQKIVEYCEQAIQTRAAFGDTLEAFSSSHIFQNACCMCILQIGELAGKLSEEARQASPDIPWREIRGMRNVFSHGYGTIILESTWETQDHGQGSFFCLQASPCRQFSSRNAANAATLSKARPASGRTAFPTAGAVCDQPA